MDKKIKPIRKISYKSGTDFKYENTKVSVFPMTLTKEQIFYPLLTEITTLTGYDLTDMRKASTRSETNVRDVFIYLLNRYTKLPPGTFAEDFNMSKDAAYLAVHRTRKVLDRYGISNLIKAGEVVYLSECIKIKKMEIKELNKRISQIKK